MWLLLGDEVRVEGGAVSQLEVLGFGEGEDREEVV